MCLRGFSILLTLLACACNASTLTNAGPYDAACDPIIEFPCEAGVVGAPGCAGNSAAKGVLERQIPAGQSYPPGCTVIVPHPVKDETGQCIFEGSCHCSDDDAGAPSAWQCTL